MYMQLFSSPVSPLTREYPKLEIPTNNSIELKKKILLYLYKLSSTPRMYGIARVSACWSKAIANWRFFCWVFIFFFTHSFPIFTGRVLGIFHALYYKFHLCHFLRIFAGNSFFSRVTLNIFSRRASHFHGQKTIFFTFSR